MIPALSNLIVLYNLLYIMSTLLIFQWHQLRCEIFFIHKSSSQKKQMNKLVSSGSFHTGAEEVSWSVGQAFLTCERQTFHVFRFFYCFTLLVWDEITVTSKTYNILVKQVPFFVCIIWQAFIVIWIWFTCGPISHSHKPDSHPSTPTLLFGEVPSS